MNYKNKRRMNNNKNREHTVKISDTNKILQKYRNSALTYNLIRKIVYDMNDTTIVQEHQ